MTKLRVSSHRLSSESGRWSKPNPTLLSERNCLFCNLLEDEYHFVLECNSYNTLRKTSEYVKDVRADKRWK